VHYLDNTVEVIRVNSNFCLTERTLVNSTSTSS